MPPLVYERRRPAVEHDGADLLSSGGSSPTFQIRSPTMTPAPQGLPVNDSSYDTSLPSAASLKTAPLERDLETDVESDLDVQEKVPTGVAARMRAKPKHALFLLSDDDDTAPPMDARQQRMARLRELAQQRAASATSSEDEAQPVAPTSTSSGTARRPSPTARPLSGAAPRTAPALADVDSDVNSDLDDALPAPAAPSVKPLSKAALRDMHRMSARLRREQATALTQPEPKRYQLSELLSSIQHSATPAHGMHSSDPVESSSTPERRAPADARGPTSLSSPSERHGTPAPSVAESRRRQKWEWVRRQAPPVPDAQHDSDSDLEVVSLKVPAPRKIRFRASPPRDTRRAQADATLAHLAVHPRTPRRQRITTAEYRSPNATAPSAPAVPDAQMDAAAHAFGLAAHKAVGELPPLSPGRTSSSPPRRLAPPPVMGLDELNATMLQKVHEQNARTAAKRAPPAPPAPAPREPSPVPPAQAPRSSGTCRDSEDDSDSDKENVPISSPPHSPLLERSDLAASLSELPVPDFGDPFDDAPRASDHAPAPSPSPNMPLPATAATGPSRTASNSSVLAQFFEAPTQEPSRNASLDIFANEHRAGPVGGMTQFFEATPSGEPASLSQQAMPPPSRAASGDAFAALRRAEHAAVAPMSPEVLPSLDPSLAEKEDLILAMDARRTPSRRQNDVLYLNEDGFFTQTKPADKADDAGDAGAADSDTAPAQVQSQARRTSSAVPPISPAPSALFPPREAAAADSLDEASGLEDTPSVSPRRAADRGHRRARRSAFVEGEAEESDEDNQHGDHGGLAGVFSDRGSGSDDESDSDDDADLSSLLDDDSDHDADIDDEAALEKYRQQRNEDDAAMQALHERAAKGMLRRRRRRGRDDALAELLDDDADEDELLRRLRAPRFSSSNRRHIEGDGMDALAARDDAKAFLSTYAETHAADHDHAKYDFLDAGDPSSDDERVSADAIRAELLRHSTKTARPRSDEPAAASDDDAAHVKLAPRRVAKRATAGSDDDAPQYARVLFQSGRVDAESLSQEAKEKRARLLEEYSHEPAWHLERGGRGGLDRRRSSQSRRTSSSSMSSRSLQPATSAPSVLVDRVLRRQVQFP